MLTNLCKVRLFTVLFFVNLSISCFSATIFAQETQPKETLEVGMNKAIEKQANEQTKEWQLWRKNDRMQVSYIKVNNSGLLKIQARAHFSSTLAQFITLLQDNKNSKKWLAQAKDSKVLKQSSPQHRVFITTFKSIWPIKARYMLLDSYYWQNEDFSVEFSLMDATEQYTSLVDEFFNNENKPIKVNVHYAHWLLLPKSVNKITVEYTFIADAKGSIPYWLSNKVALRSIWQTLQNIEKALPLVKIEPMPTIKEAF